MVVQCVLAQRREFSHQFLAHRHREGRCDADVLQHAGGVVKAQQQRSNRIGHVAVPAEARHYALGSASVLDLEHGALAGLVGRVVRPCDHTVQPRTLEALPESMRQQCSGRAIRSCNGKSVQAGADLIPVVLPEGDPLQSHRAQPQPSTLRTFENQRQLSPLRRQ